MRFMTREIAEICNIIEEVSRSIGRVDENSGSFIQVRVTLDIALPLCRGRLVSFENGKMLWVKFRYERVPNICHWCERLVHGDTV